MTDASDLLIGSLEESSVSEVMASGQLWRGNGAGWGSQQDSPSAAAADRFEDAFGQWLGLPYVHAVNSGTSANEAAIAGLGLEPGDEVICPAACPVFVPFAVLAAGCIPVFADVDPETMLLDPVAVKRVSTAKTRAIVVVHLWGFPAPMAEIMTIAQKLGLKVVEDCAQAFGTLLDGQRVGTLADACCFSLQQSKHITSGEGGVFATKNPEVYQRAVLYSSAGIPNFRHGLAAPFKEPSSIGRGHLGFGHNHRISEMQAAVALAQLSRLDGFNRRRSELVTLVERKLRQSEGIAVRVPQTPPGADVSYWRYPVIVPPGRGTFREIPYLEPAFRQMDEKRQTPFGLPLPHYVKYRIGSCPQAERGASQIRAISVHHALTDQQLLASLDASLADL